ncbi:hypothetical protein TOL_3118 [Thalassolituus oleivorans MIL-1]|uniref:Uncharacterized protein n=1 Tax=Thalassolituus oleivorans MIL-1 TaxID=1298593 RepID=M5DVE9_9GAMM|nr:hypothetical protein TOL_3118 [Thalassolituus oleivorans MIL-1]
MGFRWGCLSAYIAMSIGCIVVANSTGSLCIAKSEIEVPLNGVVVSLHLLLFTRLVAKLDPNFSRIRGSNILTILFMWLLMLVTTISFIVVSPIVFDVFC